MHLSFKQWIEYTDEISTKDIANTVEKDGFDKLNSKYMTGKRKEIDTEFDPDKLFGKKIKKTINNQKGDLK